MPNHIKQKVLNLNVPKNGAQRTALIDLITTYTPEKKGLKALLKAQEPKRKKIEQSLNKYRKYIETIPSEYLLLPKSEQDILDIPIQNRVFIYWQSAEDNSIPGYLSLCLQTLIKFNPHITLILINYDNLPELVGSDLDLQRLARLTFPIQSDLLVMYFTYKYGGAFVDVDTIYTGKFDLFHSADPNTLYAVGKPGSIAHLAFFLSLKERSFLLWHILQMQKVKLSLIPTTGEIDLPWDLLGNSIVNPLVVEAATSPDAPNLHILSNNTIFLETQFGLAKKYQLKGYGWHIYNRFYFYSNAEISTESIVKAPKHNMACLHNSWTQKKFKEMNVNEFLEQDIVMTRLFKYLLGDIKEEELIKIPKAKRNSFIEI